VFMPFALLRGRDAITAQAASNPTPPAPAMRAFRKAESRKVGFRKVGFRKVGFRKAGFRKAWPRKAWSQAATPTQAV
jgi:hypothetical protein